MIPKKLMKLSNRPYWINYKVEVTETKQFSAYLEANKELKNGLNFGFTGAFDVGGCITIPLGFL
jgi:hypothetical protein